MPGSSPTRALDLETLRRLAERHASALLGQPVSVGRMHVSIWPIPAVTGSDIRVADSGRRAPPFRCAAYASFRSGERFFRKPIVIDAVEIEGLAVTVRRDRERRWVLPGPAPRARSPQPGTTGGPAGVPGGPATEAVVVTRVRLRDGRVQLADDLLRAPNGSPHVAVISIADADLVQRPDGAATLTIAGAIGTSALAGTIEIGAQVIAASAQSPSLHTADLPALFALLGAAAPAGLAIAGDAPLELTAQVARGTGALTASGRLRAARVQFDTVTVSRVVVPFRVANDALTINPLALSAYGGTGGGTLGVRFNRSPATWTLDMRLDGLDVNALLSANTTARDRVLGTGRMAARLQGTSDAPAQRHMSGTVDVVLSNGVIHNFALLAAINSALHVTAGNASDTRFERLSATLSLAQGAMRTENAALVAGELTATAAGAVSADRTLDMAGTALFFAGGERTHDRERQPHIGRAQRARTGRGAVQHHGTNRGAGVRDQRRADPRSCAPQGGRAKRPKDARSAAAAAVIGGQGPAAPEHGGQEDGTRRV